MNSYNGKTIITNILSWDDESKANSILAFCSSKNSLFDFGKMHPRPEKLIIASSYEEHCGIGIVLSAKSPNSSYRHPLIPKLKLDEWTQFISVVKPVLNRCPGLCETNTNALINFIISEASNNIISIGIEALNNILLYGDADINEWNKHRWGTEFEAQNVSIDIIRKQTKISFETVLNVPVPLLQHLSHYFLGTEFICERVDIFSEYYLFKDGFCYRQSGFDNKAKNDRIVRTIEDKSVIFQLFRSYPPI